MTILAIDQGTTSTRSILFDRAGNRVGESQAEHTQYFPHPGWVEHDPEEIWRKTLATAHGAIAHGGGAGAVAAIGITNQRETIVVWDRESGEPVYNAIVWQDRRTTEITDGLRSRGHEEEVRERTGLLLDPYFSATKLSWILDHVPGARERAQRGELACGTIDSFLVWRLTGGRAHVTDASNASRTLLFDIRSGDWDPWLCDLFGVPMAILPQVAGNSEIVGETEAALFGRPIPISGMAGDQQAALFGQACLRPGMTKATYGTGCFVVMNTGERLIRSDNRLLSTIAWRIGDHTTYALEGSIFTAGAAIQWLRDRMGVISSAEQTAAMADSLPGNEGVYLVPAFTGLGAPHWDPHARAALVGLTLGSGPAHIVRAALESVAYQTMDLIEAMAADAGEWPDELRIDGGMAANDWCCQFLSDMLKSQVDRARDLETTARGAAYLAGLAVGFWPDMAALEGLAGFDAHFVPNLSEKDRDALKRSWQRALDGVLHARAGWVGV